MEHTPTQQAQAAQIAEVKKLLGEGFAQRSDEELARLLAHSDQRVRLRAQWALADRAIAKGRTPEGRAIGGLLMRVAQEGAEGPKRQLSQLHAVWAFGQIGRQMIRASGEGENFQIPAPKPGSPTLHEHADPEVRAQAFNVLAQLPGRLSPELSQIVASKLSDPSPRVRFFAAQALAKHRDTAAIPAVLAMLRENAGKDQYLRHAGEMVLANCDAETLAKAAGDESPEVRLAALLALRRQGKAEIARFLSDNDPRLVKEAAIAINDAPIPAAYGELAKLIEKPASDPQLMIRVINANFRAGTSEGAQALAKHAAQSGGLESTRVEALRNLADWAKPFPRDRVTGTYRPLPERDAAPAAEALQSALPQLLADKSSNVAIAAIDAVAALKVKAAGPALLAYVANKAAPAKARIKALSTLAGVDAPELPEAIKAALTDKDSGLRIEASAMLGRLNPDEAAKQLSAVFSESGVSEKKAIITALGGLKSAAADKALAVLLGDLQAGKIPGEVQLELLEAAAKREAPEVKTALSAYQNALPAGDLMAAFQPTLLGGDAANGEKLFKEHAVAQCFRCHKVGGAGGEAGPDLTGYGKKRDRAYILESIIHPNAKIAEGFQMVMITPKQGDMVAGVVKSENDTELVLTVPGAPAGTPPIKVAKADIADRANAPSGMPPGLDQLLTRREIRDIVEYVASLK
jgi:quinoprotein glucose dehydrogenase